MHSRVLPYKVEMNKPSSIEDGLFVVKDISVVIVTPTYTVICHPLKMIPLFSQISPLWIYSIQYMDIQYIYSMGDAFIVREIIFIVCENFIE